MILLEGGAILLVIVGHSGCPKLLYNLIYSFHMPLFFIISGYLFNFEKWNSLGYKSFVWNRFTSYIRPYFILCGINLCLCLIEEIIRNGISTTTFLLIGRWLFGIVYVYPNVEYMPNCTPLWFLVALFWASAIFYLILEIKKQFLQVIVIIFIALADAILAFFCEYQLPWCFGAVLIGICCMYFGHFIHSISFLSCKGIILLPILGIGLFSAYMNGKVGVGANNIGQNPVLFWISAFILSYICMVVAYKMDLKCGLLTWFGKNTILFMGFNYFFNSIPEMIWNHIPYLRQFKYSWYIKSIVCVFGISLLILVWNRIKKKWSQLSAIVGF